MSSAAPSQDYFVLRAEWLRFKSNVYDANTELPTLAAVLDDVRRLLEERGRLGLLFVDLSANSALETLHGWQAYDEVLRAFAASLRQLKAEGALGRRDILASLAVRSDKFLVFTAGAGGAAAEPAELGEFTAAIRSAMAVVLPARLPAFVTASLALHMGHAALYRDPMLRAERSVHRALDEAMRMSQRERAADEDSSTRNLDAIIEAGRVVTLYQPILDLQDGSVLGHEVFSRGPAGAGLEDPERLFALAERSGRLVALERVCRRRALASIRRHLGQGAKLFLNTSTRALDDPEVSGSAFVDQILAQGLRPCDVVLEITERVAVDRRVDYRVVLRSLKNQGFGIAIDDMGAGYSSLQSIVELEPDFLKFDISLVRNIDRSRIKRSLLETLVDLSERIGAGVIAEGIEAESEFTTLRDMGVRLGQGRYLAPPRNVPEEATA